MRWSGWIKGRKAGGFSDGYLHHDRRRCGALCSLRGSKGGLRLQLCSITLGLQHLCSVFALQRLLVLGILLRAFLRTHGRYDLNDFFAVRATGVGVGYVTLGIFAAQHLRLCCAMGASQRNAYSSERGVEGHSSQQVLGLRTLHCL